MVKLGDVFRIDNTHILACGDLEAGDGRALIEDYGTPDLTYCDPPWDMRVESQMLKRAGVSKDGRSIQTFFEALIDTVRETRGPVYLEMGKQNMQLLISMIEESGGEILRIWDIFYGKRNPIHLVKAAWQPVPFVAPALEGQDDRYTPGIVIATEMPKLVFDPCNGREETTFKAARKMGVGFIGMEIDAEKVERTLKKKNSEKVGSLL